MKTLTFTMILRLMVSDMLMWVSEMLFEGARAFLRWAQNVHPERDD